MKTLTCVVSLLLSLIVTGCVSSERSQEAATESGLYVDSPEGAEIPTLDIWKADRSETVRVRVSAEEMLTLAPGTYHITRYGTPIDMWVWFENVVVMPNEVTRLSLSAIHNTGMISCDIIEPSSDRTLSTHYVPGRIFAIPAGDYKLWCTNDANSPKPIVSFHPDEITVVNVVP